MSLAMRPFSDAGGLTAVVAEQAWLARNPAGWDAMAATSISRASCAFRSKLGLDRRYCPLLNGVG
jgi:hypothetical protein